MNDPKGGVAKVTCPTFEAMGQIPMFHRTYFLLYLCLYYLSAIHLVNKVVCVGFLHAGGGILCRPHPAATQLVPFSLFYFPVLYSMTYTMFNDILYIVVLAF